MAAGEAASATCCLTVVAVVVVAVAVVLGVLRPEHVMQLYSLDRHSTD